MRKSTETEEFAKITSIAIIYIYMFYLLLYTLVLYLTFSIVITLL